MDRVIWEIPDNAFSGPSDHSWSGGNFLGVESLILPAGIIWICELLVKEKPDYLETYLNMLPTLRRYAITGSPSLAKIQMKRLPRKGSLVVYPTPPPHLRSMGSIFGVMGVNERDGGARMDVKMTYGPLLFSLIVFASVLIVPEDTATKAVYSLMVALFFGVYYWVEWRFLQRTIRMMGVEVDRWKG